MTDRVHVRELTSCDGFALRVGDDVLVHVSTRVPGWARAAAARHLSDVVRSARWAYYATASLGLGDAICLLPIVTVSCESADATAALAGQWRTTSPFLTPAVVSG